jgi:Polyketide cyclase / dehydrase and lipid transport
MALRRVEARGPAPVEEVWDRYATIARWPEWSPQITRVEASADRLALGVRGTVYAVGVLPLAFSVTSCRPEDRTWSWQVRLGPVTLDLDHAVFPAGSGSRSTVSLAGHVLVVTAYAPLAQLALRRLCAESRSR